MILIINAKLISVEASEPDCKYPAWLTGQRVWRSVSSEVTLRVHSDHGFRLQNEQVESFAIYQSHLWTEKNIARKKHISQSTLIYFL